jgi:glycosyltransferase involved in cell wall biosynthesis
VKGSHLNCVSAPIRHVADREVVRPRILHLINNFDIGGTERQAVELLKRIDRSQFDIRLAVLRSGGVLYKEIRDLFPVTLEFPFHTFYGTGARRQIVRLRKILIDEGIDILHAHDFYAGLTGILATRFTSTKIIVCQRHLKLSDRRIHHWGRYVMNRLADRVLVNAESIRDHVIASGSAVADRVVVVRNGVDAKIGLADDGRRAVLHASLCRELGLGSEARFISAVGNLRPVKGHQYLLRAMVKILQVHPTVHLLLIGDGPLRKEIEEEAKKLKIDSNVHLLGHRTDAADLMPAFEIVVLSSLHEGMPNTVMEAMATRVAVVATAVGGISELVADGVTGHLVPPADAEKLAEKIIVVLSDDSHREVLASNGYRFICERFGMTKMVAGVEQLYDELHARNSSVTR